MVPSTLYQIEYREFCDRVAGDPREDFSRVITHVRLQRTAETRSKWANRIETRTFILLALDVLHRSYFREEAQRSPDDSEIVFPGVGPERLVAHASEVIQDPDDAARLSRQLWHDNWSNQANFNKDLFAFLFRPAPHVARTEECQGQLRHLIVDGRPRLGTLVRHGVETELKAVLDDPLADLEAFAEASFPRNSEVQRHAQRLDAAVRKAWTHFYQVVLPAYGLAEPVRGDWNDLGIAFTTVAEGVLQRARKRPEHSYELMSNGDDVMTATIISIIANRFDIAPSLVENAELQHPLT
jgi:hypothetical protein